MQITPPQLNRKPNIDGRVSPEEQAGAATITMTLVGGLEKPKYNTTAYLWMTDDGLYVGYVCDEPNPNAIVQKTAKENGPVFEDDSVQLFLAPAREGTKNNYYHFAVNSAGVKYSDRMEDDTPVDGWQASGTKGAKSWEAEMFIPFSALHLEVEAPYWRLNLARNRPARNGEPEELTAWINPGASLHNYKRFGFLQLRQGAAPAPAGAAAAGAVASSPAAVTTSTAPAAAAVTSATAAETSTGVFVPPPH